MTEYLFDGHQRFASLFGALGEGLIDDEFVETAWDPEEDRADWEVFFDLDAPVRAPEGPLRMLRSGREPAPGLISLSIILNPNRLADRIDQLRAAGRSKRDVERVRGVADQLRDYEVPVVSLATDELADVTTSFQRVNSGSTPMSELHMVKALSWTDEFDLELRIDEMADRVREPLWLPFARDWLFDVSKLVLGLALYRSSPEEVARKIRGSSDALDRGRAVIERGAERLAEVGVLGPKALPYALQLVIVGLVEVEDGVEIATAALREWFIATSLLETFAGAQDQVVAREREALIRFARGEGRFRAGSPVARARRFDFRAARSRLQALLLAAPFGPTGERLLAELGADALVRPFRLPRAAPAAARRASDGVAGRFFAAEPLVAIRLSGAGWITSDPEKHHISQEAERQLADGDLEHFFLTRERDILVVEQALALSVGLTLVDVIP